MKNRSLTAIAVLLVLCSCHKNGTVAPAKPAGIYVAGYTGVPGLTTYGTWWKDTVPSVIPGVPQFYSAALSGTDLYLLGDGGYWKNGVAVPVADLSFPKTILVAGGDVYIAGSSKTYNQIGYNSKTAAVYYKNGVEVNLTADTTGISDAFTTGLTVSGTDVYVCGYLDNHAVYWKNGKIVYLPDGYMAKAIGVSGTDVFVAGTSETKGDVYWKNGVEMPLLPGGMVTSMAISGTDVYIAGYTINGPDQAVYWKNGTLVNLPNGYEANSIAVSGKDVYAAGNANGGYAVYWKNGVIDTLGTGGAAGIAIRP